MNTLNMRRILPNFLALAIFALTLSATTSFAAEKGAERLQRLARVNTFGDLDNLKSRDQVVMVCSKCKTVMMHTVTRSKGRLIPTITARHLCTGCGATIETVGHGKAKTDKVTHTCTGCGDESVFCCATTKDGKATPGMEKH